MKTIYLIFQIARIIFLQSSENKDKSENNSRACARYFLHCQSAYRCLRHD